jgi:transcriptional regulator with XRE-family HTH domain
MATGLRNRLRLWRATEGLTLDEVSGLTGLSVAMLSRVERGERDLAPLTKVKVARRLGVSVGDLFEVDRLDVPAGQVAV